MTEIYRLVDSKKYSINVLPDSLELNGEIFLHKKIEVDLQFYRIYKCLEIVYL